MRKYASCPKKNNVQVTSGGSPGDGAASRPAKVSSSAVGLCYNLTSILPILYVSVVYLWYN